MVAYQTAFALIIGLQFVGLLWFLLPRSSAVVALEAHPVHRRSGSGSASLSSGAAYDRAVEMWMEHLASARHQAQRWRQMALCSASLLILLGVTIGLAMNSAKASVYVVAIAERADRGTAVDLQPAREFARRKPRRPNDRDEPWPLI